MPSAGLQVLNLLLRFSNWAVTFIYQLPFGSVSETTTKTDISLSKCCCFASSGQLRRVCRQKSRRREVTLGYKLISLPQLAGYVAFSVCMPSRSLSNGRSVGLNSQPEPNHSCKVGPFFTAPLMLRMKDKHSAPTSDLYVHVSV